MSISSCGIILNLLSLVLYLVVREDGIFCEGVLCVPNLGDGALIIWSTLGGAGVSTLGGSGFLAICSTLGGAPGFSRRDWNRVGSCRRVSNRVSPIFENGASGFGCIIDSIKSTSSNEAQYAEVTNGILVWRGKYYTVSLTLSALVEFAYTWWHM